MSAQTITCTGGSDNNYNITSCTTGTLTITQASTTTAITSDNPDPSATGNVVTVNFTVTPASGTNPTGNITVTDGTDSCIAILPATSCNITFNSNGTKSLTSTYAGDTNFSGGVSSTETHIVANLNVVITESGGNTDITEGIGNDTYTINLATVPTGNVEITITPDAQTDVGDGVGVAKILNFTSTATQTVTVTADDDAIVEGNHISTITHAITGTVNDTDYPTSMNITSVITNIIDNDSGVIITQTSSSTSVTEGGATDSFDVVLSTQPTNDVNITISSNSQIKINNSSLIFTSSNWDTAQSITVTAIDDEMVEDNHSSIITFTVFGGDYDDAAFVVDGTEETSIAVAIADNDIEPVSTVTYNLSITKTGNGIITTDYGINCGIECEQEFADQSEISLTATPDIGWIFNSWTGDCNENGEVGINQAKTCTANFIQEHILTINTEGEGIVNDCGTSCTQNYLTGKTVALTTTTEGIWTLDKWSGDCDENGNVTMNSDKTCTATFVEGYPLTITIPTGKGTVKTETQECTEDCKEIIAVNSITTLIAEPEIEWVLDTFSGDCDANGTVEMTGEKACTANFIKDPNIPNNGDGNGDGIHDADQPNVVSMRDKSSGKYLTLDISKSVKVKEIYTDLAENQDYFEERYIFPQGLVYFELEGSEVDIIIYYHSLQKLRATPIFQKYGNKIPGDMNTLGWYVLPDVEFDTVEVGDTSVVTASYHLIDGELGDSTVIDGRIIDPGGLSLDYFKD